MDSVLVDHDSTFKKGLIVDFVLGMVQWGYLLHSYSGTDFIGDQYCLADMNGTPVRLSGLRIRLKRRNESNVHRQPLSRYTKEP